jgi:hypothetical protein
MWRVMALRCGVLRKRTLASGVNPVIGADYDSFSQFSSQLHMREAEKYFALLRTRGEKKIEKGENSNAEGAEV